MRISQLAITWFCGAGERIALEPRGKSALVYGPNGSGKSSFVDAIEYLVAGGRIDHLANEYSGRRLEKSIINTHIPEGGKTRIELSLIDKTVVSAEIRRTGAASLAGLEALTGWQRDRVILRQEEMAAFVQADKSEKYSSILPLIGLGPLELVATNIRGLCRRLTNDSAAQRDRGALAELEAKWREAQISKTEAGT